MIAINLKSHPTQVLNQLDGRTKFIAWLSLSIVLFFLKTPQQYGVIIIFFICQIIFFYTSYERRHILKSWKLFIIFPTINLIANAFFLNGTIIASWGILSLTDTDVKIICRLLLLLIMSKAILLKTEEKELAIAIGSFMYVLSGHRLKYSTVPLVVMITLSFVGNFKHVISSINNSYLLRTIHLASQSPLTRFKNRLKLLAPILLISLKKANQVAITLIAKGYHKETQFIEYSAISYQKNDYLAFTCLVSIILLILNI